MKSLASLLQLIPMKFHYTKVYDDPDGVLLPASLANPSHIVWKRPNDEAVISDVLKSVCFNTVAIAFLLLYIFTSFFRLQLLPAMQTALCWIYGLQINTSSTAS